ncbi:MAG: PEP-CTERM sorting domain-containing protein [Pirellulales bacterium]|nr:PEP-CTERM sorting domain-containing protein [Pirellulales bacterium]
MRRVAVATVASALVILSVLPAAADWDVGDDYKMHYPQLPDPQGWDIRCTLAGVGVRLTLADDWQCRQSGDVTDIHFWFSVREDFLPSAPLAGEIAYFSIYEDVPADQSETGYSMPGEVLWSSPFSPDQVAVRHWGMGLQGWYDPIADPALVVPNDHHNIYQANIEGIASPFYQEAGNTYWLGLTILTMEPQSPEYGWKTSRDHWNDAAVYDFGPVIPDDPVFWRELREPATGAAFDLAFVIVPEPSTLAMLLAAGLAGALAWMWRRRS